MTARPDTWTFTLDFLPPSVNHMYAINPRTGRRVLTEEARSLRDGIRLTAQAVGFRPSLKERYVAYAQMTMPHWDSSDVDSPMKALLDSAFSSRTDHRIIRLVIDKLVIPGAKPHCDVAILLAPAILKPLRLMDLVEAA